MSCPCPEGNVNIPLEIQTKPEKRTCLCPRGPGHAGRGAAGKSAEFALATDRFLAPLICRVVRAVQVRGRWAWFPGGGPPLRSGFHPNLQYIHVLFFLRSPSKKCIDCRNADLTLLNMSPTLL